MFKTFLKINLKILSKIFYKQNKFVGNSKQVNDIEKNLNNTHIFKNFRIHDE